MNKKKKVSIERQARLLVLLFIGGLSLIMFFAYIFMKILWPEYAASISINYYIALAGILPVLLVALFLTQFEHRASRHKRSGWRLMLADGKTEGLVGFTVGELACLLAIATNQSKTFLLVASVFGIVVMIMVTYRRIVYGNSDF
ncbi:MAG: hypothetical protein V4611_04225 [Patescibacteria group bacterium]